MNMGLLYNSLEFWGRKLKIAREFWTFLVAAYKYLVYIRPTYIQNPLWSQTQTSGIY